MKWFLDDNDEEFSSEVVTKAGSTSHKFVSDFIRANSSVTYTIKVQINDTYNAKDKYTDGSKLKTVSRLSVF